MRCSEARTEVTANSTGTRGPRTSGAGTSGLSRCGLPGNPAGYGFADVHQADAGPGRTIELSAGQLAKQLLVDAAEPTVAHHEHVVPGAGCAEDRGDQLPQVFVARNAGAERRQRSDDIPA